jgi:hypothetical protein
MIDVNSIKGVIDGKALQTLARYRRGSMLSSDSKTSRAINFGQFLTLAGDGNNENSKQYLEVGSRVIPTLQFNPYMS